MTATKGVQHMLNNFIRLDGQKLLYNWPMFDRKAVMNDPAGLIAWLTGKGF
jgi:hypothetical protein